MTRGQDGLDREGQNQTEQYVDVIWAVTPQGEHLLLMTQKMHPTMDPKAPKMAALVAAFATIYVVWGSTYLGIRVAVESMPPFLMAGLRFIAAGGLLLLFLRLRGPLAWTLHQWKDAAIVGACLLIGGNGLVSWAEQWVPSGITALLIGVQPLVMVVTEWGWRGGERPGGIVLAGLVLGFLGVAWLAAPWEHLHDGTPYFGGVLAILAACIFWALGSIYGRHVHRPAPPLQAAGMQMLCGGLGLTLVASGRGDWGQWHPALTSGRSWAAFVYLVLIGSLVGFSCFVWLMKHSTPARVATYAYVNPVVAVLLGWALLDEKVTTRVLGSSVVIVTAVIMITVGKNRPGARPAGVPPQPTTRSG